MKKIVILIALTIGVLGIGSNVFAATGVTNSETTRLREESNSDSKTLTLIPIYQEMEIISKEGEWYKVKYNEIEGYIFAELLDVTGEIENNSKPNEESNANTQIPEVPTEPVEKEPSNENADNKNSPQNLPIDMKTKNEINVKITPLINSNSIGKIEAEKQVTVTEIINDWCYITSQNLSGWTRTVSLTQIVEEPVVVPPVEVPGDDTNTDIEVETKVGYVSATSLYVREQPTVESKIIHTVFTNQEVEITQELNSWYQVNIGNISGYVASKYISDTKVDVTSRGSNESRNPIENEVVENVQIENVQEEKTVEEALGEQIEEPDKEDITSDLGKQIVEYAKEYLGCKYVSGGTTPKGFDCSGFTQYVYAHFGISITRTSKTQAKDGEYIEKNELQLGDLVIFNNDSNSSVGHVGIYVGDNSFIHAANPKKGVVITSLSNSYYEARYVSSRRVF